jgi:dTDP-4-dehydrorhamnose 3,5-epimerase
MTFTETPLAGAFIIDLAPVQDSRGFFATTWSAAEFRRRGLETVVAQCNRAWNKDRGTLRGMHFQREPFGEVKIVSCTSGALLDVIVDLRPGSPTFCRWTSVELSAESRRMIYIPKGFAHGYLTLTDSAESYYQVSAPYAPDYAAGVRWDDPAFAIEWPFAPAVMSPRDREWPSFERE